MTQEDLAGLVGASRERVNKALSLFTRLGWIEVEGRNRYRIIDRVALQERADAVAGSPLRRVSRAAGTPARGASASAASSGRCAGRSGTCTKPWSASGYTTISQSGRSAHAARSASMSAGGGVRVDAAEDGERRADVGGGVEGLAGLGTHPVLGEPDHPVERDRAVEAARRRRLEDLHSAHAETEDRDLAHVVVDDEVVGGGLEVTDLEVVVEL